MGSYEVSRRWRKGHTLEIDMPDDVRRLKGMLAEEIIKILEKHEMSNEEAAEFTGIEKGAFSRIRNGKFWGMTVGRLIGVINELGSRVTVAIDVREE